MKLAAVNLEQYRQSRLRQLERENEHLRAERIRLERLLGLALELAVSDCPGATPSGMLAMLCALIGTDPTRPAYVEQRERMEAEAQLDRVVRVLRETGEARCGS